MKKTLIILFCLVGTNFALPVVHVTFKLQNPHLEAGIWAIDVVAVIPAGQQWRVGSSNLRYNFTTTPAGAATIHPDGVVTNPLACINTGNYSALTTTSISGGTTISFNITRLGTCCTLSTGTYVLGRIRFNRVDTTGCIRLNMRTTGTGFSVVQDSITQWLAPADFDSLATVPAGCIRLDFLTGVNSGNELPTVFKLYNNYPNPFNPETNIKYDIPVNSFVKLVIFDVLGKEITRLVNEQKSPGRYDIVWNASNYASGPYFYKIEAGDFTEMKKMILVK